MPTFFRKFRRKRRVIVLWIDRILAHGLFRQTLLLFAIMVAMFFISFAMLSVTGGGSTPNPPSVEGVQEGASNPGWIQYCDSNNISRWELPFYLLVVPDAFYGFCTDANVSTWQVAIACLIYIIGVILFTGMIISVLTNVIERRVENHKQGRIPYLLSGHYVIMGYDSMVSSFINYIFKTDPKAYVLILADDDVSSVRRKLGKSLAKDGDKEYRMKRIIVNCGDRTDSRYYPLIHLESSKQIFIVGSREHPAHDALNVECVDNVCHYLENIKGGKESLTPKNITCVFNDLDTYKAFKTTEIFGRVSDLGIDFFPYNFYTEWAKQVLVDQYHIDMGEPMSKYSYPTVYGNGITPDDPKYVHLVFIGTTQIAEAFGVEAAHVLHFPNFNRDSKLKTRITFIDLNADKWKTEFLTRNRRFFELQPCKYADLTVSKDGKPDGYVHPAEDAGDSFLDVEFEIIKGDVFSENVQNLLGQWAREKETQYLSIFLTMDKQVRNFTLGMNMPDEVYENEIPLFIRQDLTDNFVTNLRNAAGKGYEYRTIKEEDNTPKVNIEYKKGKYAHIYPFGMNETAFTTQALKRAKLINYLYEEKASKESVYGGKFPPESDLDEIKDIWNLADNEWRELSSAKKWSNLYNSYTIPIKMDTLRAMRGLDLTDHRRDTDALSDSEIEELAMVEHNRWNVEELLMGYRKPRPEEDYYEAKGIFDAETAKNFMKNKQLFIHHHIRPYSELDDTKENDRGLTRLIPWICKMTKGQDN